MSPIIRDLSDRKEGWGDRGVCFESKHQHYGILQQTVIAVCLLAFPTAQFGFSSSKRHSSAL